MPGQRPFIRYAAAIALVAAVVPSLASAQLGRLKKAAADAAKEAAGVKPEATASSANGAASLVITADRLNAVMLAMTPIMAEAERTSAGRADAAAYEQKHKAFDACLEVQTKALNSGAMPTADGMMKSSVFSQKSVEMTQRAVAAQQAKRYREYLALNDSIVAYGSMATLAMFNIESKCGPYTYKPAAMLDLEGAKLARLGSGDVGENGRQKTPVPAANRAGMTTYQFGMIRERAALWALQQTNNAPVGNNKYGVFTADEQAILEAQGAQLKKWAPYFKDQPALWATWTDIAAW